MTFGSTYPYLVMSLLLLALCGTCYAAGGKQRKAILLSALFSAPYGFLSVHFVPTYWNPVRIVVFKAGLEDIIFSFANGGIVWFVAARALGQRVSADIATPRAFSRYLAASATGLSVGIIPLLAGCETMRVALAGILVTGIALVLIQKSCWRLSILGAVSFGVLYTAVCVTGFTLYPHFLQQWTPGALSGYSFLGVPVEEIGWGVGFGAVWPLMMAFAFDVRIASDKAAAGVAEKPILNPMGVFIAGEEEAL